MYYTGNFLQRQHIANPTIPHASHLGSPRLANPLTQPGNAHGDLRLNQTMPIEATYSKENDNEPIIERTGSGGFFFFRKRTNQEQRLLSQHRAAEMIAQYELSENKDLSLNRNAKFGPAPIPSLGASLGAQQAMFAAAMEKMPYSPKASFKADSSPTKPSRPPLKSQGNIFTFDYVNMASASTPEKKMTRAQKRIEIAHATRKRLEAERSARVADGELPNEIGMNVVPISPGIYSIAPTMAETPSPHPPSAPMSNTKPIREIHRLC